MATTDSIATFNPAELVAHFSRQDSYWESPPMKEFNRFGFHHLEQTRHLMLHPLPPHRKTFHDFFLITKGCLQRSKGFESYLVTPNTLCFMPAHQITSNEFTSADAEGVVCHFDPEVINFAHHPFLNELEFLRFTGHPLVHIPPESLPVITFLLRRIEAEFLGNLAHKYTLIQSYLITLFLELGRFTRPATSSAQPASFRLAEKFKALLHVHIREKQQISDYATMLSVTPNHLNKCLRQATNRTATEWIQEMILLESKVLLSQTSLSIAEVASSVGMEDQSYFGRFFKKKLGITPSLYRKMIQKSGFLPFVS